MKTKIVLLGLVLLFVGAVLVGSTVYEEKVYETEGEPHMEIEPSGYYETRSRNIVATFTGLLLCVIGPVLTIIGYRR